jgi:hypothetical protein
MRLYEAIQLRTNGAGSIFPFVRDVVYRHDYVSLYLDHLPRGVAGDVVAPDLLVAQVPAVANHKCRVLGKFETRGVRARQAYSELYAAGAQVCVHVDKPLQHERKVSLVSFWVPVKKPEPDYHRLPALIGTGDCIFQRWVEGNALGLLHPI